MGYDKRPTRYYFPLTDFGGGADIYYHIKGPKGKAGRLYDYGVESLTEAFAAGTATPMMAVGTVADQDAYGNEFDFGALAIADGTKSIRTAYREAIDAGFDTYMLNRELPADTVIKVTCVAGTGSGLTGIGVPFVDIIWND